MEMTARSCSRARRDMLRRGLAMTIPLSLGFALLDLHGGVFWLGVLEGFVALGMIAMYAAIERMGRVAVMAGHFVVLGVGVVFLGALASGGLVGLGCVWVIGFPFVATFLLGPRVGGWWSVGFGAALAALLAVSSRGAPGLMRFDEAQALYVLTAYAAFALLAWFQARARDCLEGESLLLREALDYTPISLFITDRDGRVVYANRACGELHGVDCDRVTGEYAANMRGGSVDDEVSRGIARALAEGRDWEGELALRGGAVTVRRTVSPVYGGTGGVQYRICVDEDVTGERERQAASERTQRLESLGALAGGVAHDFNNMLAGIMGNAELLQMDARLDKDQRDLADEILTIGEQAAGMCRQLLAYAGKRETALDDVDLNATVRDMSGVIRSSMTGDARLRLELADDLPAVRANHARIQQVILNLALNAAQAMEGRRGAVEISTRKIEADRPMLDAAIGGGDLAEGRYVSVRVRDEGCGMDAATLNRIFDPFFTTKAEGTGLGLAAALGIIRSHGGCLRVESGPGRGSVFEVLLPALDRAAPARREQPEKPAARPFDGLRALVVDDDEHVRTVAVRLLSGMGMEAMAAPDGETGVAMFRQHGGRLDVVLMDMMMPGMNGVEAIRAIREIRPDVPVVMVTGYSDAQVPPREEGGPDGFVQKPFFARSLREAIAPLVRRRGVSGGRDGA